jgi:gluconolactonase
VDVTGGGVINVTDAGQCLVKGNTGGTPNGSRFNKDGRLFITDAKLGLISFDPPASKVTVVAHKYEGTSLATATIDEAEGNYFTVPGGSNLLNQSWSPSSPPSVFSLFRR